MHGKLRLAIILLAGLYTMNMASAQSANETVIREFISAWTMLDAQELSSYFTQDGVYHNMPSGSVSGQENIRSFISGFTRSWESTEWEIITLLASGDTVIVERLDKTVVNGKPVNLPCVGIFEM